MVSAAIVVQILNSMGQGMKPETEHMEAETRRLNMESRKLDSESGKFESEIRYNDKRSEWHYILVAAGLMAAGAGMAGALITITTLILQHNTN